MNNDIFEKRIYNERLVEQVKALGQEVIDRAEDIVGDGDLISDFDIWLRIQQDISAPTIEVTRSYVSSRCVDILNKKEEDQLC